MLKTDTDDADTAVESLIKDLVQTQTRTVQDEMDDFRSLPAPLRDTVVNEFLANTAGIASAVQPRAKELSLAAIAAGAARWKREVYGRLILSGVSIAVGVGVWFPVGVWPAEPRVVKTEKYVLASQICLVIAVVLLALAVYGRMRPRPLYLRYVRASVKHRGSTRAIQDHITALRSAIRNEIESALRALANSKLDHARASDILSTVDSPRLVEIDSVEVVESAAVSQCVEFIAAHDSSAIGLSGPRGIGKTTILRHLCRRDPKSYLGVYVASPVQYAPNEFIRLLHRTVAQKILEDEGRATPQYNLSGAVANRALAGAGCLIIALILVVLRATGNPIESIGISVTLAIALALIGLVLIATTWWHLRTELLVERRRAWDVDGLARAELHRLYWVSKQQNWLKNSMALKPLTIEDQSVREETERELSHPERVAAFKAFVDLYTSLSGRKVIIAIDELDKISSEQIVGAINGIKDVLHGESTHVIVSVSEDALASFALRGVPVRDVFDSSFDAVVRLERLSPAASADLVIRRVVGIPNRAVNFCHALSGGVPRDLIRFTRACVDVRRRAPVDVTVDEAVRSVSRSHAMAILDGALLQAVSSPDDLVLSIYEVRRGITDCSAEELGQVLESAAEYLAKASRGLAETTSVVRSLGPVLAGLATTMHAFVQAPTPRTAAELDVLAGDIARFFADIGLHAAVGNSEINRIRRTMGLCELTLI